MGGPRRELGVGEILLNSMDADRTEAGFDAELIHAVVPDAVVDVPIIASGGAGQLAHFAPAVGAGADAVLAASVPTSASCRSARSRTRCGPPGSRSGKAAARGRAAPRTA